MKPLNAVLLIASISLMTPRAIAQPPQESAAKEHGLRTRVVLLGTGTPIPDPDRSGPATVIVVDDRAYLVDFGPGVVRVMCQRGCNHVGRNEYGSSLTLRS
jgi:hypothetical protein